MQYCVFTERLAQLSESLRHEQDVLEKAQPGVGGVGGGTFEWVDSLLVKALRRGDWLLIDNVNFCRLVVCSLTCFFTHTLLSAVCFWVFNMFCRQRGLISVI